MRDMRRIVATFVVVSALGFGTVASGQVRLPASDNQMVLRTVRLGVIDASLDTAIENTRALYRLAKSGQGGAVLSDVAKTHMEAIGRAVQGVDHEVEQIRSMVPVSDRKAMDRFNAFTNEWQKVKADFRAVDVSRLTPAAMPIVVRQLEALHNDLTAANANFDKLLQRMKVTPLEKTYPPSPDRHK